MRVSNQTDNILKRILLAAIPHTYTEAIKDDETGYGQVTTLTILTYLMDIHGEISDNVNTMVVLNANSKYVSPTKYRAKVFGQGKRSYLRQSLYSYWLEAD